MRRIGALLVAAALAASQAAPAKRIAPNQQFTTKWMIEAAQPPAGPVSVPPHGMILKQRLLPMGLARLAAAFPGVTPDHALPKGAELVQANGPDGAVYCSTRERAPAFLISALRGGPERLSQLCFMDSDNDGAFDALLKGTGNLRTLPSAYGILPKAPARIAPLPYDKVDPASFSERYYVGLQYEGQAKIGTLRRFHVAFGSEGNWEQISDNIFTKRDSGLPKTLSVLGGAVTIRGGDGRNVVATVERTFPAQPFGVFVSTY